MLAPEEEVEVEVRWEDQQCINEFGRLNKRQAEINVEHAELKEKLDGLDDASTELMTGDGGTVKLALGECYIQCDEDFATDYCERKQEEVQALMDKIRGEETNITKRQEELRKILYARFGSSINLEA